MTRRTLLAAVSAVPLAPLAKGSTMNRILKPGALKDGDTVAIVAPSSAIQAAEEMDLARRNIESLGFKVKQGEHALDYWGYLAGTDEHRAADLNRAFEDPEVRGIICLRGGYGAGRLLDRLDYALIRQNPKVLVGYSDITALLLALYARAGLVCFHGPVAISSFGDFDIQNLTRAVKTGQPQGRLVDPTSPLGHAPQPAAATVFSGTAKGRLIGGNLSVLVSLVGSPYLPRLSGHILFLEDVGEDPYRVDRMLNTLWISGAMKGVRGIVFGDFSPPAAQAGAVPKDLAREFSMLQVFRNFLDQVRVPAYCGAWFGHIREKDTLPVGVSAEIDADARTVSILESAVTPA